MEKIKSILATHTLQKSSITFTGTILNAFFGAVFYILAARFLGPAGFGIFNVALLVMTLTADMSEMGTGMGIVNFVPKYLKKEKSTAYKYLKVALLAKLCVWVIVFLVGIIFSDFIATSLFQKPELKVPLQIAFFGVLSMLVFSFIIQALQAMEKFWSWSFVQIGTNALRLFAFVFIFFLGIVSVNSTMIVYILIPILGFVVGLKIIGFEFLNVQNYKSVFNNFFKYNKWVALFTIFAALSARVDTFITASLLESYEVGIYSAANQMVKIIPQIVFALGTVIGPKMAALPSFAAYLSYLKKTQVLVVALAFLGLLTIPIVVYLVPYIFGREYIDATGSFVVLFFSMLVFLISIPIHQSVFYYFSYPKLFFVVSFFHLLIVCLLGYWAIGKYGVIGASYTVLFAQIFDFIVPGIWVLMRIKNNNQ